MSGEGDSKEKRALAVKQRDQGLLNPADPEYDKKLTQLWGGPPIKWFDKAMETFPKKYSVDKQTALVTGSSGGIGFYVAKLLSKCGYTVIVPARPGLEFEAQGASEAIATTCPGANIVVPEATLDLNSYASVQQFAAALREKQHCIDLLCLNAGRGGGSSDPREETSDGHEAIMQVNTLSQCLLTCELLPLLKASSMARICAQTSGARFNASAALVRDLDGTRSFNAWTQYSLSKACLPVFVSALNQRLQGAGVTNIIACSSEPGLTATGVNIQHDLVKSLGLHRRGLRNTNEMHDRAGHHAADGALPMVLGSLSGGVNEYFTTDGNRSASLDRAAYKGSSSGPDDPLEWSKNVCDVFWQEMSKLCGAKWSF